MPITLPASPTLNQRYTYSGSTYQWNGTVWNVIKSTTSNSIGPTGPTGPIGTSETSSAIVIKLAAGDADYTGTATVNVPAGTYYVNQSFNDSQIIIGGQTITGNGILTLSSPATSATIISGGTKEWNYLSYPTLTNGILTSICYGPSGYLIGGDSLSVLVVSTNGVTWTTRSTPITNPISRIRYLNNLYFIGTTNGLLYTSTDSITWTSRTSNIYSGYSVVDMAYGNGTYVVASSQPNAIVTSTNAITWTPRVNDFLGYSITALAFENGIFLAGAYPSRVKISTDGILWTTSFSGSNYSSDNVGYICYGNGKYFAILSYGRIWSSTDAISWTYYNNNNFMYNVNAGFYDNGPVACGVFKDCLVQYNPNTFISTQMQPTNRAFKYRQAIKTIDGYFAVGYTDELPVPSDNSLLYSPNLYGKNKYDNYVSLTPMEVI